MFRIQKKVKNIWNLSNFNLSSWCPQHGSVASIMSQFLRTKTSLARREKRPALSQKSNLITKKKFRCWNPINQNLPAARTSAPLLEQRLPLRRAQTFSGESRTARTSSTGGRGPNGERARERESGRAAVASGGGCSPQLVGVIYVAARCINLSRCPASSN